VLPGDRRPICKETEMLNNIGEKLDARVRSKKSQRHLLT